MAGREACGRMAGVNAATSGLVLEEALHLLRLAPHAVAVLDAEGRFAWANDACARLLAWSAAGDLVGRSWREAHDPEEAERLEREAFAPARGGAPWRGEATGRRHDGVRVPLDMILTPLNGGRLALALRDISERRRAEEGLRALVYRDPLTGLPNRRLFEDRLAIAIAQAHRYRHRLAVIFLDLDRFKQVNDTLGHAAGDALLRAVSERLTESVREGDTVARLAGDEFTLLLPGIQYAEDVSAISLKLVETLRRPFPIDGHSVRVTASGGISLYPEDGEEAEALLKSADTAMYRAKERGRDNFQLFSTAMAEKALERRALE
ncbi:MAG TPA: sensor domain-containing diguanylate cyclase, partial [Vicinamibacteria bacterium]|nr:sensor domain-containing diguanylate cyclase [Vicinamibacteria bacterium]